MDEKSFDHKIEIAKKVKLLGLKSKRFSYPEIGSNSEKVLDKAKSKHRTDIDLRVWKKLKYHKNNWCENAIKNPPKGMQEIAYEEYDKLSIEEFRQKYERENKPVVIRGCTENWPAHYKWNFDVILKIYYY